jgi:hypothetical protein
MNVRTFLMIPALLFALTGPLGCLFPVHDDYGHDGHDDGHHASAYDSHYDRHDYGGHDLHGDHYDSHYDDHHDYDRHHY